MPEALTFQIRATPYGPEEDDADHGVYLQRCAEALFAAHGYDCMQTIGGDPEAPIRQLQINIPDGHARGGKRAVVITAPEVIIDANGDVMTQATFDGRYRGGQETS